MIEISAQPKLKVSNFHLGIAFIQNQSPMKTGVTMNQKAKIHTTTNIFHKYLHWEFLLILNQSRVYSYLLLDLPDMKMVATHF